MVDKAEQSIFQKWAPKVGKTVEEIENEFLELLETNKKKHASEKAAINYTMMQLRTMYTSALRTNAIWFQGMVLGMSEPNYYMVRKYEKALQMYNEPDSRDEAVELGMVNEDGAPVDDRDILSSGKPNPNYNVPLAEIEYGTNKKTGQKVTYKDKCVMNVVGIARKIQTDEIKMFNLTVFDTQAQQIIDMVKGRFFVPMEFRLNARGETEDMFELGFSVSTSFKEMTNPPEEFALDNILTGNVIPIVEIPQLEKWFDQFGAAQNSIVFTKGMVSNINLEQDWANILHIDELTLDIDVTDDGKVKPDITVSIPKSRDIDFGEASLIYVIGHPNRSMGTTDAGQIRINAFGFYVPPEYKVELNEEQNVMSDAAADVATGGMETDTKEEEDSLL